MAATRQSSGGPVAAPAAHEQEIARLSIDTIRALSMDAVQKANAGHPGTAMALAPLGYVLFEEFLNVDPQDPSWPDRDRFVLSCRPRLRPAVLAQPPVRLGSRAGGPAAVPPVGLAHARPPGARARTRRRDHHRPARAGRRQRGRDGDGRALPRRALQPPQRRGRRSPHLGDLLRRGHDGGGQPGSGFDRGQLRAREADRLLRRKPHHDRRHHLAVLRRREPRRPHGRRRLARAAGGGLRGPRRPAGRAAGGPRRTRAPVLHRDPLAHRLPGARTPSTPPSPTERRSARRRSRPPSGRWASTPTPTSRSTSACTSTCRCASRAPPPSTSGASASRAGAESIRRWPRTGTGPGRDGCATAGRRRCRASRPVKNSPPGPPARRRWPPSRASRRR